MEEQQPSGSGGLCVDRGRFLQWARQLARPAAGLTMVASCAGACVLHAPVPSPPLSAPSPSKEPMPVGQRCGELGFACKRSAECVDALVVDTSVGVFDGEGSLQGLHAKACKTCDCEDWEFCVPWAIQCGGPSCGTAVRNPNGAVEFVGVGTFGSPTLESIERDRSRFGQTVIARQPGDPEMIVDRACAQKVEGLALVSGGPCTEGQVPTLHGCNPRCGAKEEAVGGKCVPKCRDDHVRKGSACVPLCPYVPDRYVDIGGGLQRRFDYTDPGCASSHGEFLPCSFSYGNPWGPSQSRDDLMRAARSAGCVRVAFMRHCCPAFRK